MNATRNDRQQLATTRRCASAKNYGIDKSDGIVKLFAIHEIEATFGVGEGLALTRVERERATCGLSASHSYIP